MTSSVEKSENLKQGRFEGGNLLLFGSLAAPSVMLSVRAKQATASVVILMRNNTINCLRRISESKINMMMIE